MMTRSICVFAHNVARPLLGDFSATANKFAFGRNDNGGGLATKVVVIDYRLARSICCGNP